MELIFARECDTWHDVTKMTYKKYFIYVDKVDDRVEVNMDTATHVAKYPPTMRIANHPRYCFQLLAADPNKAVILEKRYLTPSITMRVYVCEHRKISARSLYEHLCSKASTDHPCVKCHRAPVKSIGVIKEGKRKSPDDPSVEKKPKTITDELIILKKKYPTVVPLGKSPEKLLKSYAPGYYMKKPRVRLDLSIENRIDYAASERQRILNGIIIESKKAGVYDINMPYVPQPKYYDTIEAYLKALEDQNESMWEVLSKLFSLGLNLNIENSDIVIFDPDSKKYITGNDFPVHYQDCREYKTLDEIRLLILNVFKESKAKFNDEESEYKNDDEIAEFIDSVFEGQKKRKVRRLKVPLFFLSDENPVEYYIKFFTELDFTGHGNHYFSFKSNVFAFNEIYVAMIDVLSRQVPEFNISRGNSGQYQLMMKHTQHPFGTAQNIKYPLDAITPFDRTMANIVSELINLSKKCYVAIGIDHQYTLYGRIAVEIKYSPSTWTQQLLNAIDAPEWSQDFYPIIRIEPQSEREPEMFSERIYFGLCWISPRETKNIISLLRKLAPESFSRLLFCNLNSLRNWKRYKKEVEDAQNDTAIIMYSANHAQLCIKTYNEEKQHYEFVCIESFEQETEIIEDLKGEFKLPVIFIPRPKDQPHEATCMLHSLMRAIMCIRMGWQKGIHVTYNYGSNPYILDYAYLVSKLAFWARFARDDEEE